MQKNIVLYFPYRKVGGVSVLFLRLAEDLCNQYKVFIADFSDGYMAKHVPENCTLIDVDRNPSYPENSIFIFQAFPVWRLPNLDLIPKSSKLFLWVLHPKNFEPSIVNPEHNIRFYRALAKLINIFTFINRKKINKLITYLEDSGSIAYMDREVVRSTEKMLKTKIPSRDYLPVPIPKSNIVRNNLLGKKKIRIAWIGRLCDFKYLILMHLMKRLCEIRNPQFEIEFLVIGDGEYYDVIDEYVKFLNSKHIFNVSFYKNIDHKILDKFIASRVDILFAMGTSALEGARIGIPVFLTDYTYTEIKENYRFKLLYDNDGFCLGQQIDADSYEARSTLEESLIFVMKNYDQVSLATYSYWVNNFSLENITKKLNLLLLEGDATFGDLDKLKLLNSPYVINIMKKIILQLRRKKAISDENGLRIDC